MSHSRFTRMPGPLVVAAAASFCAVAQAGPVETIYSAENALYGAGYEIGKADGWMDNTLRSAIRQYQSSQDGLQATGALDPQTLSALGIAVKDSGTTIKDNAVPSREAAMAALDLDQQRLGSSSPRRPVAPPPEPEPQPEPEQVSQEEPEAEPVTTVVSANEQERQPEPETPSGGSQAPVAEAEEPAPAPVASETTAQVESSATATSETVALAAEPEPEPEQKPEPEETPVEVATIEEPSDTDPDLPEEPTAVGNPEEPEPAQVAGSPAGATSESTTATKSNGGFFSSIFDFLFGWLI